VAEVVVYLDGGLNLGVSRRQNARRLARKAGDRLDKPAKACPVEGVTTGTSRWVAGWRLDRERLREAVAAFAPSVPVVEYLAGTPSAR
jgi:hypothetical protein